MTVTDKIALASALAAFFQAIIAIIAAYIGQAVYWLTKAISTAEHRRQVSNAWQQYNLEMTHNEIARSYIKMHDKGFAEAGIENEKDFAGVYVVFARLSIAYELWHAERD